MYNSNMENQIKIPADIVELVGKLVIENLYKNKALAEIEKKLEQIEKANTGDTQNTEIN